MTDINADNRRISTAGIVDITKDKYLLTYNWRCDCKGAEALNCCPYGGYKSLHRNRWYLYASNLEDAKKQADKIRGKHEDGVTFEEVKLEIVNIASSKMTDAELRLAIAEIIAKENGWTFYKDTPKLWTFRDKDTSPSTVSVPNYPGDIAATMGLLDEFPRWELLKLLKVGGGSDIEYSVYIYLRSTGPYKAGVDYFFAHNDQKCRAICEAWLTTRKEKECLA